MTTLHLWQPGDRVNWDASSSRGYGYQPSIAATVHKLGDKRVQIEVARKPPYEKHWVRELKWVDALALRPRLFPVSALGEPLEMSAYGFKLGFIKTPYGAQTLYYGSIDGDHATSPCHTPENALQSAMVSLREGNYLASLRTLIELFEQRGTIDEREVQQQAHAHATLARIQAQSALNRKSWSEANMREAAEICQNDNSDDSPHYFEPEQGTWTFWSHYPLDRLLHENYFASRERAFTWLAEEIQNFRDDDMPERAEDYRRMLFEPIDEPVVLGEVEGKAQIWDGWHRTAVAIIRNEPIRAIVGTPNPEVNASVAAKKPRKNAGLSL